MKRIFDIMASLSGLLLTAPILLVFMLLVWLQDRHSPFYIAPRIARHGRSFQMIKLRSMVIHADKSGVDSTSADDRRITTIGRLIRRYKLDELTQLMNVFTGDMSLVGPRPQVARDVALYTEAEKQLLTAKPGITDFASIVFSDEGDILAGRADPDLTYNQLIRPGKSRLGLFYIHNRSLLVDIQIILFTILAIISRPRALRAVAGLLRRLDAPAELIALSLRTEPLTPAPPPGADEIVTTRTHKEEGQI